MSEYWKSTPKYWCKHCSCYVRDTKLERSNHEATAKHQGALKRSLRNLHRDHEREEREKERAQREIARLNGVVGGSSSAPRPGFGQSGLPPSASTSSSSAASSDAQVKTQREQLAALGVAIPSDFRPGMAMPGEWTVTSTRIIDGTDELGGEGGGGGGGDNKADARAIGVGRKRGQTEEDEHRREEEEAMRGLFKKPRRWGRDSRTMPEDEDGDLDALLSGTIPLKKQGSQPEPMIKQEEGGGGGKGGHDGGEEDAKVAGEPLTVKKEEEQDPKNGLVPVKEEPDTEPSGLADSIKFADEGLDQLPQVKTEEGAAHADAAAVVFKKRKPKAIRSK